MERLSEAEDAKVAPSDGEAGAYLLEESEGNRLEFHVILRGEEGEEAEEERPRRCEEDERLGDGLEVAEGSF